MLDRSAGLWRDVDTWICIVGQVGGEQRRQMWVPSVMEMHLWI